MGAEREGQECRMVGSKGKGAGRVVRNGGRMPAAARLAALPMLLEHGVWAHSVVLRARACVRAGNGAGTAHTPNTRSPTRWGSHAGLSPSGVLESRDWVAVIYVDMRGGMFLAHFRRLVREVVVVIHACTVPRGHPRGSAFKGSHAVCFPGHGEGQYNNVMHS